jgi:outer membrane protein OmpA-like peptidoglycan-associated protein
MESGTTVVMGVSNAAGQQPADLDAAQGDYEAVVTITGKDESGIRLNAFIDAEDGRGKRRQATIPRLVLPEDLETSRVQILGFMTDDPLIVNGATALGVSKGQVNELLTTGSTMYSFQNYRGQRRVEGRLTLAERVKFSVLLNGQRLELDALRATANLPSSKSTRPFEQIILDHPEQPLSLRIAWGPEGATFPFKPDFAREIVRIDTPVYRALDAALMKDCRVEVPGVYFDFNEATIKPSSKPALENVAVTLRKHPDWRISIEGHTDNIGGERYNDDLSMRRAVSVRNALQKDLSLDIAGISVKGWGLRRPVESNDTLAGRARNRRVELVRDCAQR